MLIVLLVAIFFSDGRPPEVATATMPSGATCVEAAKTLETQLRQVEGVQDVFWNCLGISPAEKTN